MFFFTIFTPFFLIYDTIANHGQLSRNYAQPRQFPYQAGLHVIKGHRNFTNCGGSLISENWVLTAGSCTEAAKVIIVKLGHVNFHEAEVSLNVTSNNIITHPSFSYSPLWGNVGLIRIPRVTFTSNIQPVKLPKLSFYYSNYLNEKVITAGWGRINNESERTTKGLRYYKSTVNPNYSCSKEYDFNTDCEICATAKQVDPCISDSGSPLVLESTKVQIGISSVVPDCSVKKPPTFSRITCYLQWIRATTGIT